MRATLLSQLMILLFSSVAVAQECPVELNAAAWQKVGCELSGNSAEFTRVLNLVNTKMASADEEARHFMAVMAMGGATAIDLSADRQIWLFETTSILNRGEMRGIIGPYLPRSDVENALEAGLIASLATPGSTELREVLGFVKIMAENRGGKLLVGLGKSGMVFPMVVTSEFYCRWSDFQDPNFALLGSINQLSDNGQVETVEWRKEPADCNEGES